MIKRKPKVVPAHEVQAEKILQAHHFDNGDGSFAERKAVIAANLESLSKGVRLNPGMIKAILPKGKIKPMKVKPPQTKRPSQKAAEAENKAKPAKKLVGKKSPAAKKPNAPNPNTSKKKKARRTGGGGGGKPKSKKVAKEHITVRWDKMTPAARASYIQAKAGKSIKTADADNALGPLWGKMSSKQQKAHLRRHPNSRLKVKEKAGTGKADKNDQVEQHEVSRETKINPFLNPEEGAMRDQQMLEKEQTVPGPQDHQPDTWWNEQTPEDQQAYLDQYPNSRFAIRHRVIARNIVGRAKNRIKRAAQKVGNNYHQGMEGLRARRNGEEMTQEQKEGLKKTATAIGSVLVLSLIAVSIFTPLGPAAMEFGEAWFRSGGNVATSSDEDEDGQVIAGVNLDGHELEDPDTRESREANEEQLEWMTQSMTEYLLKQNVSKFAAKISKQSTNV